MYDRAWHTELSRELEQDDEGNELQGLYALVFQVELIFYLLERLRIGQALHAPWFLLSGLDPPPFAARFIPGYRAHYEKWETCEGKRHTASPPRGKSPGEKNL
jgi:hypothetical protein